MLRDYSYIRSALLPGEHVVFATTLHWVFYMRGLVLTLLGLSLSLGGRSLLDALLSPALAAQMARPLAFGALGVSLVGCFLMLMAGLRQSGTELVVTNRRVVAKCGILSRTTYEMLLNRIEGANIQQSAWGRVLGYGTVVVRGVGTNLRPMGGIDAPEKFQNALLGQIQRSGSGA